MAAAQDELDDEMLDTAKDVSKVTPYLIYLGPLSSPYLGPYLALI